MSRKITIYGWKNIDNRAKGVLYMATAVREHFQVINEDTGEIYPKKIIGKMWDAGRWFLTFTASKKAMIEALEEEIKWRQNAVPLVKKIRLKHLTERFENVE